MVKVSGTLADLSNLARIFKDERIAPQTSAIHVFPSLRSRSGELLGIRLAGSSRSALEPEGESKSKITLDRGAWAVRNGGLRGRFQCAPDISDPRLPSLRSRSGESLGVRLAGSSRSALEREGESKSKITLDRGAWAVRNGGPRGRFQAKVRDDAPCTQSA